MTILPSRNQAWGFYGSMAQFSIDADTAWSIAMRVVADVTGCGPEAVRRFLDSRLGRHFADDVISLVPGGLLGPAALRAGIEQAAARWQRWTVTPRTSRLTGIPAGLPYLSGHVAAAEIEIDQEAE